jgi:hypothetical protein
MLGDETFSYDPGHYLVVSIDLPVSGGHGGLEIKAIPRDEPGPRRETDTVAANLRQDPMSDETSSRRFPQQNDAGITRSSTAIAQAPRKTGGQCCTRTSVAAGDSLPLVA